jgi:hypothetical protein
VSCPLSRYIDVEGVLNVAGTEKHHHRTGILGDSTACEVRVATFGTEANTPPAQSVVDIHDFIPYRAVDNQMFVAMCSPARNMEAAYHAVSSTLKRILVPTLNTDMRGSQYGYSMVVNPT